MFVVMVHPEQVSNDPAYLELFGKKQAESLAVYAHHHNHNHSLDGEVIDPDHDHTHEGHKHGLILFCVRWQLDYWLH